VRVVLDTNAVVSGLFWRGAPRRILDTARSGAIQLFTTAGLLAELEDVLGRPRFAQRLTAAGATVHEIVLGYASLVTLVQPARIDPVVIEDPDDDAVLACALAANAEAIVSGDAHLLGLKQYQVMPILTAAQLLSRIPRSA